MFGEVLLISLLVFPFVYGIGYLIQYLFYARDLGRVGNTIKHVIFFVGAIVHEISHRVMCAVTGVPAYNTTVKYRDDKSGRAAPHGSVTPRQPYQMTFLQAFLVCFAPLLVGAWIIYFLLQVAFSSSFDPIYRIIAPFCAISILLTSPPSRADLSMVKFGYQNDPQHSQYQIFLVVLSFLISWFLVGVFNIILPYEFFYYFIIIFWYIVLKYSFISLRILFSKIRYRKGKIPSKVKKRLIKRRFRPEINKRYYED